MSDFGLDFNQAAYEQMLGPRVPFEDFHDRYNQENPIGEDGTHQGSPSNWADSVQTGNAAEDVAVDDGVTGEASESPFESPTDGTGQNNVMLEELFGEDIARLGKGRSESGCAFPTSTVGPLESASSPVNLHPQPPIDFSSMQSSTSPKQGVSPDVYHDQIGAQNVVDQDQEFWLKHVRIFNENAGHHCVGSYLELYTQWPELRTSIIQRFNHWQQGEYQNDTMVYESAENATDYTSNEPRHPQQNTFGSAQHNSIQSHSFGAFLGSTPIYGGAYPIPLSQPAAGLAPSQTVSTSPLPLLIAVPAQKGVRYTAACPRCERDVIINGKNDGKLCTRCFNSTNDHRRHLMQGDGETQQAKIMQATNQFRANPGDLQTNWSSGAQVASMSQQVPASRQYQPGVSMNGMSNRIAAPPVQPSSQGHGQLPQSASSLPGISGAPQSMHYFVPPPTSEANLAASKFDPEHVDIETARNYVARQPAKVCVQLNIKNDNWQRVKGELFNGLVGELLEALSQSGSPAPFYFNEREVAYYNSNHDKAYRSVLRDLKTPEEITMAKARAMLAIDEVVGVHETGIPKTIMNKVEDKTHRGHIPDLSSTCLDRARKVISYARSSKYIALDILRGNGIGELARSPDRYMGRKFDNCQTNAGRSKDLTHVRNIKAGNETTADLVREGPRKRGAKPNVVNGIAVPSSSKTTPTVLLNQPGNPRQPPLVQPTAPNTGSVSVAPASKFYTATTPLTHKRKRDLDGDEGDSRDWAAKRARVDHVEQAENGFQPEEVFQAQQEFQAQEELYTQYEDEPDEFHNTLGGDEEFWTDGLYFDDLPPGFFDGLEQ